MLEKEKQNSFIQIGKISRDFWNEPKYITIISPEKFGTNIFYEKHEMLIEVKVGEMIAIYLNSSENIRKFMKFESRLHLNLLDLSLLKKNKIKFELKSNPNAAEFIITNQLYYNNSKETRKLRSLKR